MCEASPASATIHTCDVGTLDARGFTAQTPYLLPSLANTPAPSPSDLRRERALAAVREEEVKRAREQHATSKSEANRCWADGQFEDCRSRLDECIATNGQCDTLRRYRSAVRSRLGDVHAALDDAHAAVTIDPRSPDNHFCRSRRLLAMQRLPEAGRDMLAAMRDEAEHSPRADRYTDLLRAVRRNRSYFGGAEARRYCTCSRRAR